ncbi:hypothetical protein FRC00_002588, partial [Tulasnella sp. 408]
MSDSEGGPNVSQPNVPQPPLPNTGGNGSVAAPSAPVTSTKTIPTTFKLPKGF